MTVAEQKLWKALRKLGLHMRRQAPIGRYIVDFACHEACLVIEVDGPRHDLPDAQLHDFWRDEWLRSQGYRVLRFRNVQMWDDPDGVVATIKAALPIQFRNISPFPLDGERAGDWGECRTPKRKAYEADPPPAPICGHPSANTPNPALPPSRGKERPMRPTLRDDVEGEGLHDFE